MVTYVRVLFLAVLCLSTPNVASPAVWVVDGYGRAGFTHTDIQSAVDAAGDGDTILVRKSDALSNYPDFTVSARSLVIVGESGDSRPRVGGFSILNLAATQTVVVRGFGRSIFFSIGSGGIVVRDCQGPVRIEDVNTKGRDGNFDFGFRTPSTPGCRVSNCSSVALLHCELNGGAGSHVSAGHGLSVSDSHVVVSDCLLKGGSLSGPGGGGGGMYIEGQSTAFLARSSLTGGSSDSSSCGSRGLVVLASSTARLLDCLVTWGENGESCSDPIYNAGKLVQYTETARGITVDSPLREPEVGTLSLNGLQGDVVLLLLSPAASHVELPFHRGVLLVGTSPLAAVVVGPITNLDGSLDIPFTVGELGPGVLAETIQIQAAFSGSEGGILGPVTVLTALDSSF